MRYVHTQIPDKPFGTKRAAPFEVPPFCRIGEGRIAVSGKWSPSKSIVLTKVQLSCSYTTGASSFVVLKGNNNASVDTTNATDVLYQGGTAVAELEQGTENYTEIDVSINLSENEWIAVAEFVVNPCVNPVITFAAQEDLKL